MRQQDGYDVAHDRQRDASFAQHQAAGGVVGKTTLVAQAYGQPALEAPAGRVHPAAARGVEAAGGASPRPTIQCLFGGHAAREANSGPGAVPAPPPASGGGTPMPAAVQAKMEGALGADFSNVRIHQGPEAQSIGALAYAQGTNLHFAPGQYDPGSQRGQELLGHELVHVVQQAQGRVSAPQGKGAAINHDPALEHEADIRGAAAARGEYVAGHEASAGTTRQAAVTQSKSTPSSAAGPVQATLSVLGKNLTTFSEKIGVPAYDNAFEAGDFPTVRAFEEALIHQAASQVPCLTEFINAQKIKVTVPRGLHRNTAVGTDYTPEQEIHQTLNTLGMGGHKGPNWHLIYKVDNGVISFVRADQTNAVDAAAFLKLVEGDTSQNSPSTESPVGATPMEMEEDVDGAPSAVPPSTTSTSSELSIPQAYFYFANYGIGGVVHGYIQNARVIPTGETYGNYFEALVKSGETPPMYQSFTKDRPLVSPIQQKVWFSKT
jgi:hypothetical protein